MPKYKTIWLNCRLPDGKDFTIAVCGYSGQIRHMSLEKDVVRQMFITSSEVSKSGCNAGEHCLAKHCPLNKTEPEHLAHMLDMWKDEPLDDEVSKLWGTTSTVEALVDFADKMNQIVPENLKKRQKPIRSPAKSNT